MSAKRQERRRSEREAARGDGWGVEVRPDATPREGEHLVPLGFNAWMSAACSGPGCVWCNNEQAARNDPYQRLANAVRQEEAAWRALAPLDEDRVGQLLSRARGERSGIAVIEYSLLEGVLGVVRDHWEVAAARVPYSVEAALAWEAIEPDDPTTAYANRLDDAEDPTSE